MATSAHDPERRSGEDRRQGDRRGAAQRRSGADRRSISERLNRVAAILLPRLLLPRDDEAPILDESSRKG